MVFLGDAINYGKWATSKLQDCTGNWETLEHSLFMDIDQPTNGILCVYVYGHASTGGVYYDNIDLHIE